MLSIIRHLHHRHATPHSHPNGKIFAWFTLLACIGDGAFLTMFPIILLQQLGSEQLTSYYSSGIAVVILLASIASTALFTRFSRVTITKWVLSIAALAYAGMTAAAQIWHLGGLDIPRAACIAIFNISLSLFLASFYKKEQLGEAEGRFFLFNNMGWFIGPILGGWAFQEFGSESIFVIASVSYLAVLGLFLHQHFIAKHPHLQHAQHETKELPWKHLVEFFGNPKMLLVFAVSLGLAFWFNAGGLYRNLQLQSLDLSSLQIGLMGAAMVVPLIALEPFVGKFGDRYGVRPFIIFGFAWLAAVVGLVALFSDTKWLVLLLIPSVYVGAACLEPLRDTFFYQTVRPRDKEKYYGIYNLANPIASIGGPVMLAALFSFGGYSAVWAGSAALFALCAVLVFFASMKK